MDKFLYLNVDIIKSWFTNIFKYQTYTIFLLCKIIHYYTLLLYIIIIIIHYYYYVYY